MSVQSVKAFVSVNLLLLMIGGGYHWIYRSSKVNFVFYLFLNYFYLLAKNYFLLNLLESKVQRVELITLKKNSAPKEKFNFEFDFYLMIDTLIETISISVIPTYISSNFWLDLLFFIPKTFLFEIIFDFFHYWAHRFCHYRFLYFIHKKHHQHQYPRGITVFYQDPLDLIMTNFLPMLLTSLILPLSQFQLALFLGYKTFIEISGHLGRRFYPTSCFPQFIWLPQLFGIELYCEDHDLHHTHFKYNFAKRFSLWDRVFGTFKRLELHRGEKDDSPFSETYWFWQPKILVPALTMVGLFCSQYFF